MNVFIDRRAFHAALATATRAVATRSSLRILSNVLLETNGDSRLLLRTTDLELSIAHEVACDVRDGGSLTLPAKTLSEIVAALPDGLLTLEVADDAGTLRSGRSIYRIQGLPAVEYPPASTIADAPHVELPQPTLHALLRSTLPAISPDDTRPIITGALFSLNTCLTLAATDSHRLAVATAPVSGTEAQAIIPGRALRELLRLLDAESDRPVAVELAAEARFTVGNTVLVTRYIDGTFPDYERIIPSAKPKITVVLETEPLIRAIKRAAIVARDNANRLTFQFSGPVLAVTATAETGTCREELEVQETIGADEFTVALNSRYLLDAIEACGSDSVRLAMTEPLSPVVIRPVGSDGFLAIVMPMTLPDDDDKSLAVAAARAVA